MSRKGELLKLAQLFHSQARLTLDRSAKQVLRKLGDHYQNEATVVKRDDRKHVGKPTLAELQTKLSELSPTITIRTESGENPDHAVPHISRLRAACNLPHLRPRQPMGMSIPRVERF
ncbi:MAG: hypothetical protein WCE32_19880 [Pseudolabrys sp.]